MKCPDCGKPMLLQTGKFGYFYGCTGYPECRCSHSAKADGSPVGIPANAETRALRQAVHQKLDTAWRTRRQRNLVYQWLAHEMGMGMKQSHVGRFNKEQCLQALEILKGNVAEAVSSWQKARRSFREVPHGSKRRRKFRFDPEADIYTRKRL